NYTGAPRPLPSQSEQLIAVNLSRLKFSDIRRPYPTLSPQTFEIAISNAGSDRVTELTIGFRRSQDQPCSINLEDYDGFKKFSVNLQPGDSVTMTGEFSAQAMSFCIVRAFGPPEGLSACLNSGVSAEVAIAACTRTIRSGEVQGIYLAAAYVTRA